MLQSFLPKTPSNTAVRHWLSPRCQAGRRAQSHGPIALAITRPSLGQSFGKANVYAVWNFVAAVKWLAITGGGNWDHGAHNPIDHIDPLCCCGSTAAALALPARLASCRSPFAARRYPHRVAASKIEQDEDTGGGRPRSVSDCIDRRRFDRRRMGLR